MGFGRIGRAVAAALVTTLAVSACGSGGSGDQSASPNGLEKDTLNVGIVPVPDAAPLYIAIQKGYFKEEGLTVKPQVITASPEATAKLVNGSMDLALFNYVALFVAQDKGAAKFKVVSNSFQATNNSFAVMAGKDSGITSPAQLKGKKVAVAALQSITHLLMTTALAEHGLKEEDVKAVPMPLPNMEAALKQGSVDAIAAVEPFVSSSQKGGAKNVLDLVDGPNKDFPIAGWAGTEEWYSKYPKTAAAFQRAMTKALQTASNREEVVKVIPTYSKIPAEVASTISLGTYPATIDPQQLQRVADVLSKFGYIKNEIDVNQVIAPAPAS